MVSPLIIFLLLQVSRNMQQISCGGRHDESKILCFKILDSLHDSHEGNTSESYEMQRLLAVKVRDSVLHVANVH